MPALVTERSPYEDPRSVGFRMRQKRYRFVKSIIDRCLERKGRCRILDLGGTEAYWDIASGHVDDPRIQIDLINMEPMPATRSNVRAIVADACDMGAFDDQSYDFLHSNSLIEHVGTWDAMTRMALNVRRLAPVYFVQTPYFWFPIEPHFRFPVFHWMPEPIRYRLILSRDMGFMKKAGSVADAVRSVQSAMLLDRRQFSTLFPDAEIKCERILGVTKSLMAIRSNLPTGH
jgi:hypothetical protein